jgi:hypothetical protein
MRQSHTALKFARASTRYRKFSSVVIRSALLLLTCSCGLITGVQGTTTPISSTSASQVPALNNQDIVYDGDGLHIEAQLYCRAMVVLATGRLSYDTDEVRAMQNFFVSRLSGKPESIPSTLVHASGGPCGAHIELTNIGAASIVVDQVGLKVLTTPRPNTYEYRRLNLCPFIGLDHCASGGTGSPNCTNYYAEIDLSGTAEGDTASGTPTPALQGCPSQLTVDPGLTAMLLDVELSGSYATYSTALHLRLLTPIGTKTLTLTEFHNGLVFAEYKQYSCYLLQGTTFVLWADAKQAFPPSDNLSDLCS